MANLLTSIASIDTVLYAANRGEPVPLLKPPELFQMLGQNKNSENQTNNNTSSITLLDSREPAEFSVSHIQGAQWIGYTTFDESKIELPSEKDSPIVVYCSLGVRSHTIGQKISKLGYSKVYNLWGGIFEWKNQGFPVVNEEGETEKVHAYNSIWGAYLKKGQKVMHN